MALPPEPPRRPARRSVLSSPADERPDELSALPTVAPASPTQSASSNPAGDAATAPPEPPPRRAARRPTRRSVDGLALDSPSAYASGSPFDSPDEARDALPSGPPPPGSPMLSPVGSSENLAAAADDSSSATDESVAVASGPKLKSNWSIVTPERLAMQLATLGDADPFSLPNTREHAAVDKDGLLRAGSLFKIVELATYPTEVSVSTTGVQTLDYVNLLVMLRSFASPDAFATLLAARAASARLARSDPIKAKVATVFRSWIRAHWRDFVDCPRALEIVRQWMGSLPAAGLEQAAVELEQLIAQNQSEPTLERDLEHAAHMALVDASAPPLLFPPGLAPSIRTVAPQEFARQLTLMEHAMLRAVDTRAECIGQPWTKKNDPAAAHNLKAFIRHFNIISQMVCRTVLAESTPAARAREIANFIDIATQCLALNNFNGLMEILAGLQFSEVFRLQITWDAVPAKALARFTELKTLMSREKNMKAPRAALAAATPPCVPYVGMYLTDLTFAEDGNADLTADGLINVDKRRILVGIVAEVARFQKRCYVLRADSALQEWIVSPAAEPYDENAAYARSLELESREAVRLHKESAVASSKSVAKRPASVRKSTIISGGFGHDESPQEDDGTPRVIDAAARLRALTMVAASAGSNSRSSLVSSNTLLSVAHAAMASNSGAGTGAGAGVGAGAGASTGAGAGAGAGASTLTDESSRSIRETGAVEPELTPDMCYVVEAPSPDVLIVQDALDSGGSSHLIAGSMVQLLLSCLLPMGMHAHALDEFAREFLLASPFFTSPAAVLATVTDLWDALPPAEVADDQKLLNQFRVRVTQPLRQRIVTFLSIWRNEFPDVFNEEHTVAFASFVDRTVAESNPAAAALLGRPKSMRASATKKRARPTSTVPSSPLFLPGVDFDRAPDGAVRLGSQSKIVRFEMLHPEELARQIFLVLYGVYESIRDDELATLALTSVSRPVPNITTALLKFQHLSNWAATEVVRPTVVEFRLLALERMIAIGDHLVRMRCYDGAMAVFRALSCPSIEPRLWTRVTPDGQARWAALQQLAADPEVIAAGLDAAHAMGEPMLPYLGAAFMSIKALKRMPDEHASGLIHWAKWSQLTVQIRAFSRARARKPAFTPVPFILSYFEQTLVLARDKREELAAKHT